MIHERPNQSMPLLEDEGDAPTQPRIRAVSPVVHALAVRSIGTASISLDEQGNISLQIPGHATIMLCPEEAFDLLDFLFDHRNLLAARSAEVAERLDQT